VDRQYNQGMSTPDHVVMAKGSNAPLLCLHCGVVQELSFPMNADSLVSVVGRFTAAHEDCPLTELGLACMYCRQFGHPEGQCPKLEAGSPEEWLAGPDTGISSRCICFVMMGGFQPSSKCPAYPPQDPDDFGRCHRFLTRFPEFRPRLGEVAAAFPHWGPLVRDWDKLTALYEEELPTGVGVATRLYGMMKALLEEGKR
jgi:hypothetical protein